MTATARETNKQTATNITSHLDWDVFISCYIIYGINSYSHQNSLTGRFIVPKMFEVAANPIYS